jgi:DNA-binding response OmpR family regulator
MIVILPVSHQFKEYSGVMFPRILIADDSQDTLQMLEVFLEFSGWEVFCASNLEEARAKLDANGIDAVILDRWFGNKDGLELCREIRGLLPGLPVVFLSGAAYPDDVEEARNAGCDAYLVKPCDVDELASILTELLLASLSRKPLTSLPS